MIITQHAIDRYIERVAPGLDHAAARSAIEASEPAITKAVAFGCKCVIHPTGARLILYEDRVVTVIGKGMRKSRRYDRELGEQ